MCVHVLRHHIVYILLFETLLKYTVFVLSIDPLFAAMVKGEFIIGAVASRVGRDGKIVPLLRPCVDCGLVTGSFCESSCFAEDWL